MFKFATLALLAGLATTATTLPSFAQVNQGQSTPEPSSSDNDCAYQLNYMPRVTRAQIDAIENQSVYLVPICEDRWLNLSSDYGWLFASGNVGTLLLPIANNAALMRALTAEGYDQYDVISLRFGGGYSVALYVHQRELN